MATVSGQDEQRPLLEVVNPDATPEEVAALVAVLSAVSAGGAEAPRRTRQSWGAPARDVRRTPRPGPEGWRTSGLPR
ncbi:acyl-CoA carboxylase subunit epsilon [Nocardioides lacusdianchii]|uniref:acyl-CoA carboxylase subunit epsilon n=1 Tax=Nocardioides lacusdianchii TaxID=2783664 RepID=UPI001CCB1520|nr:acyl-CoA carboxylase subunit epsilon [Nocardioides lacusdianchii]